MTIAIIAESSDITPDITSITGLIFMATDNTTISTIVIAGVNNTLIVLVYVTPFTVAVIVTSFEIGAITSFSREILLPSTKMPSSAVTVTLPIEPFSS